MASNELEHYGIKGMKWGVRRTLEELGHYREYRTDMKKDRKLRRQTAAAIKNMKEKGETVRETETNVFMAKEDYLRASKKMYLFKQDRLNAIEEASKRLTEAFQLAEKPRADFQRSREIYDETAEKFLKYHDKMMKKYGDALVSEIPKKTIEYGITEQKSGMFTKEYTAFVDEVLNTGLTVVNIPWYGQRYTGKFVAGKELTAREDEFLKKAKTNY